MLNNLQRKEHYNHVDSRRNHSPDRRIGQQDQTGQGRQATERIVGRALAGDAESQGAFSVLWAVVLGLGVDKMAQNVVSGLHGQWKAMETGRELQSSEMNSWRFDNTDH